MEGAEAGRDLGFGNPVDRDDKRALHEFHGHQVLIGATLGISVAPDDGADPDQLLKNADLALYRAKGDGRGNYRFFEAGMDARALARRTLELELRTALSRGEFELQYQPLLDIKTSNINCCEALLRLATIRKEAWSCHRSSSGLRKRPA